MFLYKKMFSVLSFSYHNYVFILKQFIRFPFFVFAFKLLILNAIGLGSCLFIKT